MADDVGRRVEILEAALVSRDEQLEQVVTLVSRMASRLASMESAQKALATRLDTLSDVVYDTANSRARYRPPFKVRFSPSNGTSSVDGVRRTSPQKSPSSILKGSVTSPPPATSIPLSSASASSRPSRPSRSSGSSAAAAAPPPPPPTRRGTRHPPSGGRGLATQTTRRKLPTRLSPRSSPSTSPVPTSAAPPSPRTPSRVAVGPASTATPTSAGGGSKRTSNGRVLLTAHVVNGLPTGIAGEDMKPALRTKTKSSHDDPEPWSPIKAFKAPPTGMSTDKAVAVRQRSKDFAKRTQEEVLKKKTLAVIDQLVEEHGLEQLHKLTVASSLDDIRAEEREIRQLVADIRQAARTKLDLLSGLGASNLEGALGRARDILTLKSGWVDEPFFHALIDVRTEATTLLVPQKGDREKYKTGSFVDAAGRKHNVLLWAATFTQVAVQLRDTRQLVWLMKAGSNPYIDGSSETDMFQSFLASASADMQAVAAELRQAAIDDGIELDDGDDAGAGSGSGGGGRAEVIV